MSSKLSSEAKHVKETKKMSKVPLDDFFIQGMNKA